MLVSGDFSYGFYGEQTSKQTIKIMYLPSCIFYNIYEDRITIAGSPSILGSMSTNNIHPSSSRLSPRDHPVHYALMLPEKTYYST